MGKKNRVVRDRDERDRQQARERRIAWEYRVGRVRRRGWFSLVGAVLLGALALVLAFGVAEEWSRERPFEQAISCDAVAPTDVTPPADCLLHTDGTVASLHEVFGKDPRQFVKLRTLGVLTGDISFSNTGFYEGLTVGQSLAVTFWRGDVVELAAGGVTARTDNNPTGTMAGAFTFDLLAALGALWLGHLSFWYLRRTEPSAATPAPPGLVLPVRAACVAVVPGVALAVYLGTSAGLHATIGTLLLVPGLLTAVLALATATLWFPWMRRPGAVRVQ